MFIWLFELRMRPKAEQPTDHFLSRVYADVDCARVVVAGVYCYMKWNGMEGRYGWIW